MADVGAREQITAEFFKSPGIKTSKLLSPGKNPLLRTREKLFINALVRGTSFEPSRTKENVQARGLSQASMETLREMVTEYDGNRKPFAFMVNQYNSRNRSDSPIELTARSLGVIDTVAAGIKGDLDSVIERVVEGSANCLEFSLVMQLTAKVFYPDEIKDAELLAYSENRNIFGEKGHESRHFYLFTRDSQNNFYLTAYAGRHHRLTREDATQAAKNANAKDLWGLSNIYNGFVTLIDRTS